MSKNCDVCGRPVESWPCHDYHDDDCPNFVDFVKYPEAGSPHYECDCDYIAHPECCPQCNDKKPYTAPAITHELDLETKAGSPSPKDGLGIPGLEFDDER